MATVRWTPYPYGNKGTGYWAAQGQWTLSVFPANAPGYYAWATYLEPTKREKRVGITDAVEGPDGVERSLEEAKQAVLAATKKPRWMTGHGIDGVRKSGRKSKRRSGRK